MTAARVLLVLVLAALVAGCGYSHKPLFDTTYRTVSVPIFDNRTFYRGVEFDLTEALKKQIELRTPYKVVNDESGDTILRGSVVAVRQNRLSREREGGMVQELEMALVVDFEWKDQRTGEAIVDRRGLVASSSYVPAQPVGEPLAIGQHMAAERMADSIVGAMRSQW